jgi:hypothetical protein
MRISLNIVLTFMIKDIAVIDVLVCFLYYLCMAFIYLFYLFVLIAYAVVV